MLLLNSREANMDIDEVEDGAGEGEFESVIELGNATEEVVKIPEVEPTMATPVQKRRGRPRKDATPKDTSAIGPGSFKQTPTTLDAKSGVTTAGATGGAAINRMPSTLSTPITSPGRKRAKLSGSVDYVKNLHLRKANMERQSLPFWEEPYAPARMSRPATRLTGKTRFSIGFHLLNDHGEFARANEQVRFHQEFTPFPHWRCPLNSFNLVDEGESTRYLPGESESIPISFMYGPDVIPFQISRFASHCKNDINADYLLNVGGSVVDLAWCPLPWLYGEERPPPQLQHSFLAISTTTSISSTHNISAEISQVPNMLQIWDLGAISAEGPNEDMSVVPFMSLGLIHEYDFIYQLSWCPIATPHPQILEQLDVIDMGNGELEVPRLGLLSAACADGSLRIFAIPHPHALHQHLHGHRDPCKPIFLELRPVWTLKAPDNSPICRVAWSHLDSAGKIAAGTIDGKTLVWALPLDDTPRRPIPTPIPTEEGTEGTEEEETGEEGAIVSNAMDVTLDERLDERVGERMGVTMGSLSSLGTRLTPQEGGPSQQQQQQQQQQQGAPLASLLEDRDLLGLEDESPPPIVRPMSLWDPALLPIFFRKTHTCLTTAIRWHPTDPNILAIGMNNINSLLWDIRTPSSPIQVTSLTGACTDMAFAGADHNFAILISSDDGETKALLPPSHRTFNAHLAMCLSLDYSPLLRLMVSCGADGLIYLTALTEPGAFILQRKPVTGVFIDRIDVETDASTGGKPLFKFAYSSVACANQLSPPPNEADKPPLGRPKGNAERVKEEEEKQPKAKRSTASRAVVHPKQEVSHLQTEGFKDNIIFINKIRWSPNLHASNWLAYGIRGGLVRVQHLPWVTPPIP